MMVTPRWRRHLIRGVAIGVPLALLAWMLLRVEIQIEQEAQDG